MKQEKQNKGIYRAPAMTVVEIETLQMIAMSTKNVTVGGWVNGGSLGGGEAVESVSRRGKWGNLWYNN